MSTVSREAARTAVRLSGMSQREQTALWALEQAITEAKHHGIPPSRSAAVRTATAALQAVIEGEVE